LRSKSSRSICEIFSHSTTYSTVSPRVVTSWLSSISRRTNESPSPSESKSISVSSSSRTRITGGCGTGPGPPVTGAESVVKHLIAPVSVPFGVWINDCTQYCVPDARFVKLCVHVPNPGKPTGSTRCITCIKSC